MLDMNSSYLHVLNRICEDVQQEMGSKLKEDNEIDWTVNVEVLFFYSMIGHKPVGVNRHFMMLLIHNKFSAYINHQISSKVLWNHLDSMYDMAALHESEIIPFPNEERDFELPEDCYDLLRTKCGVTLKKSNSEGDVNKNSSNSAKALKKLTPKLKQSGTPVSTPKNSFATPAVSKPPKNLTVVKNETKVTSNEATPKVKQESGSSSKTNKIRRSSSPFSTKLVKSEPVSATKEDSPDIVKKFSKPERGSSPAIPKKPSKADSSTSGTSSKKPHKNESSSSNGSKPVKAETPDASVKKIKVDKDVSSKKGKAGSPAEVHTKKVKVDANGVKKKSEAEGNSKKTGESSSLTKSLKPEVKSSSSKGQEMETPPPSGSRKSSPVVKIKSSDSSSSSSSSNKKLKRPRVEETSKKSTPTPKRRRL